MIARHDCDCIRCDRTIRRGQQCTRRGPEAYLCAWCGAVESE